MLENTEQWISGGNCDKCRRSKHCGKECTQHKRYRQRAVSTMVTQMAFQTLVKANQQLSSRRSKET